MKKWTQSKTIWFNAIMAVIQSANASIAMIQPLVDTKTFVIITLCLGMIHAAGGVWLRAVTNTSVTK